MEYINVKTGIIISVKSEISGENFKPVIKEETKEEPKKKSAKKK